jgi:pimeloyl-ACP methyl ester carboxylesterase
MDKPILVLLPGLDGTGELFAPLLETLGAACQTMVIPYPNDLPLGYGALAERVRARLPRERPFVLLGESFAGPLAISLAGELSPNLRGLILVATFARNPRPRLAWLKPWVAKLPLPLRAVPETLVASRLFGRHRSQELLKLLQRVNRQITPAVMKARLLAVAEVEVSAIFARLRLPVLYLRATRDRVVPAASSQYLQRLRPDMKISDLACSHCLLQCLPEDAARLILKFLEQTSG